MLGTFDFCTQCNLDNNCCCDFNENIDFPILSNDEYKKIIDKTGLKDNFSLIENNCVRIIAENGKCPFYKNSKCEIYEIRPNDCKLFPYDIKKIEKSFYLIQYELNCNFEAKNENIDSIIELIKPYINIFTDEKYNFKLQSKQYKIIKKIQ